MLLSAKIKNFASFKDEVSINFEASREAKFSKYLPVGVPFFFERWVNQLQAHV